MSSEPEGIGIEVIGLAQVAVFLGALLPGYLWISKGKDQASMLQRGALVGGGLLAAAIVAGLLERKQ